MEGCPSGSHPKVGVCLINSGSQIFVASRLNVPGAWQKCSCKCSTLTLSEIDLANGGADTEFSEWKWASPEEVSEEACCIMNYKRPIYEEVIRTFQPFLNEDWKCC